MKRRRFGPAGNARPEVGLRTVQAAVGQANQSESGLIKPIKPIKPICRTLKFRPEVYPAVPEFDSQREPALVKHRG
jgi:hypothetical protein